MESLGSRPAEIYAEHKNNAERLDYMQRRLDAARVLSDILTPEQIQQLGGEDFDAKMQYENNLKKATQHYRENKDAYLMQAQEEMNESIQKEKQLGSATADFSEGKASVVEERANVKSPEEKIAKLEQQIESMKQWLIQDSTYTPKEVDSIIRSLKVEYNEETQQAEVVGDIWLDRITSAEGLELPDSIEGSIELGRITSAVGLTLPYSIGGGLHLEDLTSAEGLLLPHSIGGGLHLRSLTSTEGLLLPQRIGLAVFLNSLTSTEREQLRAQRPDLADKIWPKD